MRTGARLYTAHPYIVKVEGHQGGEPMIGGAHITVRTIVERVRLGTSAEELVRGRPGLTLAQVYDALSYCCDPPDEIDTIIAEHRQALEHVIGFSQSGIPGRNHVRANSNQSKDRRW